DKIYDDDRVKALALHAYDLYENRKEFSTLKEALQDSILSVAATRRHGKTRKTSWYNPEELANLINTIGDGKISIVFGCESNGLSDEEVNQCNLIVTIPTSDAFPSLNLSQAVQIICYSLFQQLRPYKGSTSVVNSLRVNKAKENCIQALTSMGYFKTNDEKNFTSEFLEDIITRAGMTEKEIQKFEKLFTKAEKIALYRRQNEMDRQAQREEQSTKGQ
ncbi:MAG: RNA methyltransferase, partial [Sphaerochaetaceae bacterium]|nr:RNA methyltransferase [Sphaerochaetaceae bacterium]